MLELRVLTGMESMLFETSALIDRAASDTEAAE
jgi:hypothetical protein